MIPLVRAGICLGLALFTTHFASAQPLIETQVSSDNHYEGAVYPSFIEDGAWCWFSDPRAIYYEGENHKRTYTGWVNSKGDIMVGFYDHESGDVRSHIVYDRLQKDDHNNPSLLINGEGHLLVFYSRHADSMPILMSKSVNPEDISSWERPVLLDLNDVQKYSDYSNTYTYTNPRYLSDEDKIYIYWRGSDFKPNFSVSPDGGKTWSKGRIFILPERKYRDRRPYIKVASNQKDRIDFAFTDGHPHNEPQNSIYYMYYKNGSYHRADGTMIKSLEDGPVNPGEADVVYDATKPENSKAWIWDVAEDKQGNPVIVYTKFPDNTSHICSYARWDGESWNNYDLVNSGGWFPETPEGKREREPNYSGGIVLDQEDPNIVYLSREKEGVFEIEKWTTNDKGASWNREIITSNSDSDNVRPAAVLNAGDGNSLQFLWMKNTRYVYWTDYLSSVKMGLDVRLENE